MDDQNPVPAYRSLNVPVLHWWPVSNLMFTMSNPDLYSYSGNRQKTRLDSWMRPSNTSSKKGDCRNLRNNCTIKGNLFHRKTVWMLDWKWNLIIISAGVPALRCEISCSIHVEWCWYRKYIWFVSKTSRRCRNGLQSLAMELWALEEAYKNYYFIYFDNKTQKELEDFINMLDLSE